MNDAASPLRSNMNGTVEIEGDTVEEAMAHVAEELGADAQIVDARKAVSGGIGGFFAKERVVLTARRPDGGVAGVLERMTNDVDSAETEFGMMLRGKLAGVESATTGFLAGPVAEPAVQPAAPSPAADEGAAPATPEQTAADDEPASAASEAPPEPAPAASSPAASSPAASSPAASSPAASSPAGAAALQSREAADTPPTSATHETTASQAHETQQTPMPESGTSEIADAESHENATTPDAESPETGAAASATQQHHDVPQAEPEITDTPELTAATGLTDTAGPGETALNPEAKPTSAPRNQSMTPSPAPSEAAATAPADHHQRDNENRRSETPAAETTATTQPTRTQATSDTAWRIMEPADTPDGAGRVDWSVRELVRNGIGEPVTSAVTRLDPRDDLGWINRIAESVVPLCNGPITGDAVVVGGSAGRIGEMLGLDYVEPCSMAPYRGSFYTTCTGSQEQRDWLQYVLAARPLHIVLDDSASWKDLLVTDPSIVSWIGTEGVATALQLAAAFGARIGFAPATGHPDSLVRATPIDIALAVRSLMRRT